MRAFFAMLLCFSVQGAPEDDPSFCVYWMKRLGEIAELERSRLEVVPQNMATDGYYSATDYDIDLRARIVAIMRRMERDAK